MNHTGQTITQLIDLATAKVHAAISRESIGPWPTVEQRVRELMNQSWEAQLIETPIPYEGGDLR